MDNYQFITIWFLAIGWAVFAALYASEKADRQSLEEEVERLQKVASDAKAEEMRHRIKAAETRAAFGRLLGEELAKMKQQNSTQNETN